MTECWYCNEEGKYYVGGMSCCEKHKNHIWKQDESFYYMLLCMMKVLSKYLSNKGFIAYLSFFVFIVASMASYVVMF